MSTGAWPKAQTSSKEDEMPPKQERYKFFVVSTIVQFSASSKNTVRNKSSKPPLPIKL